MNTTQRAVTDAIDGGYCVGNTATFVVNLPEYALSQLWIDPKFWQCLGKTRKWEKIELSYGNRDDMNTMSGVLVEAWKHNWHLFIDHLSFGKDVESFFLKLEQKKIED